MVADGLKMNALTIRWDETQPTSIDPDLQNYLTQVIAAALTVGVQPAHAQQPAGVTAAVNPDATGTPPAELPRILEVGGKRVVVTLVGRDDTWAATLPDGEKVLDSLTFHEPLAVADLQSRSRP